MEAFIFDMDGVIIDSEPLHSRVKMVMDEEHRTVTTQIVMSFDEARDPTKYLGSYYTKINNTLMMEKKTFK